MDNYEMRIAPQVDAGGNTYWTASFPAVEGCVGGGETVEEAVQEAKENLKIFLAYLKEKGAKIPTPYVEPQYSGKIALRLSKSTHSKVALYAEREGVSINSFLVGAIENYLGMKQYDLKLEEKIEKLQETSDNSLYLQKIGVRMGAQVLNNFGISKLMVGDIYE